VTDKERPIRILLPFDVSSDSLSALDAAFGLAAALGGEVSGLFIEDSTLLLAGSLPFAREIGSQSGISRRIGTADIEHSLRAVASRAREALIQAGQQRHVTASFHVTRGDVGSEILTAAGNADLVVIGKAGWSTRAASRIGSTCLTLISHSHVPVLIVERGATLEPPVLAVDDGSPGGRRALEFARMLGKRLGWQILSVRPDDVTGTRKSQLMVVPGPIALTTSSELRGAIVVVP
jgi:nucleotide-binding universal stress UspA family protein